MFWRFQINDDPGVLRFLIRDADSRLNLREKAAVDAWVESGRKFHVMRDHRWHRVPMPGGMWGAVKGAIPDMTALIKASNLANDSAQRSEMYGKDQLFLARFIWPLAKNDCMQHDSRKHNRFPGAVDFPTGRIDGAFVGQRVPVGR
jgi:hypothetical protein